MTVPMNYKKHITKFKNPITILNNSYGNKNITLSILNKLCSLFGCSDSYLLARSSEFDYEKLALINTKIEADDLEGISSMNRIYMNMKYITSKMDD